jgi:carboxyl-terminal processing protease
MATRLGDFVGKTNASLEKGMPDSVIDRTYYTQKGREVFGGGGIKPDINIKPDLMPDYIRNLQRRRLFFDFAIDHVSTDSTWLENNPNLMVNDEMVSDFIDFVQARKDGEIVTKTGLSQIEEIEGLIEDMGWGEEVQESVKQLRVSVEQVWDQPFSNKLKPHIKKAIHRELILRFRGRKTQLLEKLEQDQQLAKAVEVLVNQDQYFEVLADNEIK